MYEHVRVCRDCGEEYRPEIARCADCGGELEDRFPGQEGTAGPVGTAVAALDTHAELADYRVLYQTARATDLVPMAERLRERETPYRLAEQPGSKEGAPPRYALLVREEDAAGALALLADLLAPHEDPADVHAVETRFDSERGYLQCPACATSVPHGAAECPECGLGFGPGGEEAAEEPRE